MTLLETYITEHEQHFLEDLKGWLRIPSISILPEHAGDVLRAFRKREAIPLLKVVERIWQAREGVHLMSYGFARSVAVPSQPILVPSSSLYACQC